MSGPLPEVYLARHCETAWALDGRHTGRTDVPLTVRGEREAASLGERLRGASFTQVWTSPLARARRTCELAGFAGGARVEPDLMEWDYGDYEGRTGGAIRAVRPDWDVFRDGCPAGESPDAVGRRADRVIARLRKAGGRILVFGHGHFCRVLAVRWIRLPVSEGGRFLLATGAVSVLGYGGSLERPAIRLWNHDGRPPT
jgi:broad specificity phosphatase PhoE